MSSIIDHGQTVHHVSHALYDSDHLTTIIDELAVIGSLHVLMHILNLIDYGIQFIAFNLIVHVQPFVKYSSLTMDWIS